jgi:ubiquinone/menaquinone biosynthesis C-methylase UbiE
MRRPKFIARQGRRPSGLLGEIVGRVMSRETFDANAVALKLLELGARDRVLEVGFGHGATLQKVAEIVTSGFIAGIDHSPVMLRMARRRNALYLKGGRMELKVADSLRIPYPDTHFNKVFAVHIVYFWPQLELHLREIFRVMLPGGKLVLGYHPLEDARFAAEFPRSIYLIRSLNDIEDVTGRSGFHLVRTETREGSDGLLAWTVAQKLED